MAKLRVAVIGGGIAGLTLAVALRSMDSSSQIEVDIYEGAPEFAEIGAGINAWPRAWSTLQNIGLEKAIVELLGHCPDDSSQVVFHLRKSDQPEGESIADMMFKGGSLRFHRADFQKLLLNHIPSTYHLHLSRRLVSYTETSDDVQIEFEDGSSASCDFLIGADGIKSVSRKVFLANLTADNAPQESSEPVWTGTAAFRGLVPSDVLEKSFPGHRAVRGEPVMYWGKNKHVVVYPVAQRRLINVVAFFTQPSLEGTILEGPAVTKSTREEVFSIFAGWEPEVTELLRCISSPSKWAIQALNPLSCWAKGRVALVGDAAHAMAPHLGAGAGQAIEDAYVLATLLSTYGRDATTISQVTHIYDTVRRPLGNRVLEDSHIEGKLCQLNAPGFENVKEGDAVPFEKLQALCNEFIERFDWVWKTSAEVEKQQALAML